MKGLARLLGFVLLGTVSLVAWAATPQHDAPSGTASQAVLPVSHIVLYSSGVGYFQRDGRIDGRAEVALRFKADNINDLLKSMVIQDFDGGRVTTVTYDARDPIAKTLQSFAVDLTRNPSLIQLLGQMRGEGVEIATPQPLRGIIVSVEKKREALGEQQVVEVEYLNVLTPDGLRSLPLNQVQHIQMVNAQLNAELRQALAVLATGHDTQKKAVLLQYDGAGRRRVRVAYIVETPVWKTSYRLVLSEAERPFLQGWAIVENTTDEDWQNVQLSLISGRPVSFVMDLYEPLYVQRPVVVPELYASLGPQIYEQAMEEASEEPNKVLKAERAQDDKAAKAAPLRRSRIAGTLRGMAADASPASARPELDLQQGVIAAAQVTELGELFEYAISTPVSLARQKSAMLPIVSQEVEGTRLSIYNEDVHAKHPLNGFRLKNATGLHLMQGPLTVFDGGTYAGDARIADLPPGQEQLISYAVDLKTEVEPVTAAAQQQLVTVSLRKGTLLVTHKAVAEKTYNVKNRDQKQKLVLVEHPFRADWQLAAPSQPAERTRAVYRFALTVQAGQRAQLRVHEEKSIQQTVRLMDAGPDLILYYLQAKQISPTVKGALQQVVKLRDRLNQTRTHLRRLVQRTQAITQEQSRIRQNMTRLAQNSALYNRYVGKLDQQETELETVHLEIEKLKATADLQERELNDYLLGLDVD